MGKDLLTRSKELLRQIKESETDTDQFHAIWNALYAMKFDSRYEMLEEIKIDNLLKFT